MKKDSPAVAARSPGGLPLVLAALLLWTSAPSLAAAGPPDEGLGRDEPILPIPRTLDLDARKVALGERLFHDPRLSANGTMACAFCHRLEAGGDDDLPRSITNSGAPDVINAPTVFNSGFNFRQTWRGAFRTLEEQAEGDLHNPRHAATTWDELLPKLKADPDYPGRFRALYPDGITRETVLDAIALFERSLITPDSPFDRWLRGDPEALTEDQQRGFALFKSYGCIGCHQGVNVGGNLFQRLGLFGDYFERRGAPTEKADLGRFNVTGLEADRYVFRVPPLRNVAVTGPWFHDGGVGTLTEAVQLMGELQLGRRLPEGDVADLVAFLESLTGLYRGRPVGEAGP